MTNTSVGRPFVTRMSLLHVRFMKLVIDDQALAADVFEKEYKPLAGMIAAFSPDSVSMFTEPLEQERQSVEKKMALLNQVAEKSGWTPAMEKIQSDLATRLNLLLFCSDAFKDAVKLFGKSS